MGSDRCSQGRLLARCCHGVVFGFGFVFTVLAIVAMFWIAWCYFGLAIIQASNGQRRAAAADWSNASSKTVLPSPTTSAPVRATTSINGETSSNSISKLPTTESLLRGFSRGESQVKFNKRKEAAVISSLAKGDFAARDRATAPSDNTTVFPPKVASTVPSPRGPSKSKDELHSRPGEKASILTASEDSEEDGIYPRRVLPPGIENRPEEKVAISDRPRLDILPTKVYGSSISDETPRAEKPPIRPSETRSSDYPDRDSIQSSRRSDSDVATVYRDPDFDRDRPHQSTSYVRGGSRYDDLDDERGSRGRYDKRDRGRPSDGRLSKGDTRVYPDDRDSTVAKDDRYSVRDSYPADVPRRGDDDRYDDRYKEYDDRPRSRDRDTRYRDRDLDEKTPLRDDRYRDRDLDEKLPPPRDDRYRDRDLDEKLPPPRDDRYRDKDLDEKLPPPRDDRYRDKDLDEILPPPRDDRYRDKDLDEKPPPRDRYRDDDRYRPKNDKYEDESRYRPRDDDRYVPKDDDKVRPASDDRYRYRDDDRYRYRDDERYRDDDRYRVRDDDRYRTRNDDKYRSDTVRSNDKSDDYGPRDDYLTSRVRDTDVRESSPTDDRRQSSSRSSYDTRVGEAVSDYDRSKVQAKDSSNPSRSSRPTYDEDRYRDRDRDESFRRPSRYDVEDRQIAPTRTRSEYSVSKSSLIDARPRESSGSSRYIADERDRAKEDSYYDQDRSIRLQGSRRSSPASESTRRYSDDNDERYQTRLPNERNDDPRGKEEKVLDRRSYASEESDEYRRRGDSKYGDEYDDRTRRPVDEPRRYKDEESYSRRDLVDDRSISRDNYERDRSRSRDRSDEEYRRYDDRYPARDDRLPPLPIRKYDTYDDDRSTRRDKDVSTIRKEVIRDREENLRPSPPYSRSEYTESRRRYDDDLSIDDSRDIRDERYSRDSRKPTSVGEAGSSVSGLREQTDIVIREKRFQNSNDKSQSSRLSSDSNGSNRRFYDEEPASSEEVRPPLSKKDVIETAIRQSDGVDQNARKVYYPVFDPRFPNLTSSEIIRPNERRGTTITAKKRRSA